LGYTGPITREESDKALVLDEQGRPLLDDAGRTVSRYAFDDPIGQAGLDAALEDLLRGQSGGYMAKVNARGQLLAADTQYPRNPETNVPPEHRRFPLQHRGIANQFPPGSTIKPFMAAAGLQESLLTPDTKLKCLGHIEVPSTWDELQRNTYWCWTRDASHQDL